MVNNGERSPDCGDIGLKSKSEEMSSGRLKHTKNVKFTYVNEEGGGSGSRGKGVMWSIQGQGKVITLVAYIIII